MNRRLQARSNTASALTRRARAALKGRVESVTVKSNDYFQSGEVAGAEVEPVMAARQVLADAGLFCSPIKEYFGAYRFYVAFAKELA